MENPKSNSGRSGGLHREDWAAFEDALFRPLAAGGDDWRGRATVPLEAMGHSDYSDGGPPGHEDGHADQGGHGGGGTHEDVHADGGGIHEDTGHHDDHTHIDS